MSINWDALVIGPTMAVFGEPITYTRAYQQPITITGVFDDAYLAEAMFEDGSTGVTELAAVLGVQLSQLPWTPEPNDRITVQRTGAKFFVREMRNDSHGWGKLLLTRSA